MTHPITPPPELVQEWIGDYYGCPVGGELSGVETAIAARAAQWGADQELKACCKELEYNFMPDSSSLRAARRPKPPSLKEQGFTAMALLKQRTTDPNIIEPLSRALEALPE